jgi:hypothetical protein
VFAAQVRRHWPMVRGIRRLLGRDQKTVGMIQTKAP